ncbi:MAG TPA: TetR/AcrR family transcriptional regulator [Vicinamibacterales bacterium]|jgi:AcrR family transcriptional regulator
MSPRPRTVPDAQILGAAQRAMARLGPKRLTLADVAKEAGLSPATLVQRFGSKRGLMLALWADALDGVEACFSMLRPAHPSPMAALVAAATQFARWTKTPEEMANHLAFLQIDLSDPDFRQNILEMSRRTEAGYRALLDEAITARELVKCDTRRLARAVGAISGGSLIGWAVFREGNAASWVRKDLETLLKPYRRNGRSRVSSLARRGSKER